VRCVTTEAGLTRCEDVYLRALVKSLETYYMCYVCVAGIALCRFYNYTIQ